MPASTASFLKPTDQGVILYLKSYYLRSRTIEDRLVVSYGLELRERWTGSLGLADATFMNGCNFLKKIILFYFWPHCIAWDLSSPDQGSNLCLSMGLGHWTVPEWMSLVLLMIPEKGSNANINRTVKEVDSNLSWLTLRLLRV